MGQNFSKVKKMLKNGQFFTLLKAVFRLTVLSFVNSIVYYYKIKNLKKQKLSLNQLIEFTSNKPGHYVASLQVKSEIAGLLETVKEFKPKTMMEIGTARGGSLFLFSRILPAKAFIISLDLPGGSFGGGYPFWKIPLYKSFASNSQKIELVRANSHEARTKDKITAILGERKLDFLFIDGDHTYEGVKRDFELYSPFVKKGGIIAFHDIAQHPKETNCNVSKFWDEIKQNYRCKEFIEDKKQGWGGIGVIYLD
jgi:predicted O-methyltransferase YrrM